MPPKYRLQAFSAVLALVVLGCEQGVIDVVGPPAKDIESPVAVPFDGTAKVVASVGITAVGSRPDGAFAVDGEVTITAGISAIITNVVVTLTQGETSETGTIESCDPALPVAVLGDGGVMVCDYSHADFPAGGLWQVAATVSDLLSATGTFCCTALDFGSPPTGPIEVVIDIKPGSDDNPINLKSHGSVPVAILGSADFDVTTVDVSSVTLGEELTVHVIEKKPGKFQAAIEDVNGDPFPDLVMHFSIAELTLADFVEDDGDDFLCVNGFTDAEVDPDEIHGCDNVKIKGG